MFVKCLHCSQVQQVTDDYPIPGLGQNFTCKRCGKLSAVLLETDELFQESPVVAAKPRQKWLVPLVVVAVFALAVILIAIYQTRS